MKSRQVYVYGLLLIITLCSCHHHASYISLANDGLSLFYKRQWKHDDGEAIRREAESIGIYGLDKSAMECLVGFSYIDSPIKYRFHKGKSGIFAIEYSPDQEFREYAGQMLWIFEFDKVRDIYIMRSCTCTYP